MEVKPKITKLSHHDASNWFGKMFCWSVLNPQILSCFKTNSNISFCSSWVIPFFQLFVKHSNFDTNESTVEIEDLERCAREDDSEVLYSQFERFALY